MSYKSPTQPFCRCCGKPIRKATHLVECKKEPSPYDQLHAGWISYLYGEFRTKEDVQRQLNTQIVSVARSMDKQLITRVTTWDGESYDDPHFCTNSCAIRFAHRMAELGYETKAHAQAVAARRQA